MLEGRLHRGEKSGIRHLATAAFGGPVGVD